MSSHKNQKLERKSASNITYKSRKAILENVRFSAQHLDDKLPEIPERIQLSIAIARLAGLYPTAAYWPDGAFAVLCLGDPNQFPPADEVITAYITCRVNGMAMKGSVP